MGLFRWIGSMFLKKRFENFWALLKEAFPIFRQVILGQLSNIAIASVQELAKTDLNNESKRNEAFRRIKDHAIKNGIDARDSLINVLIEMAVLKFKKEF